MAEKAKCETCRFWDQWHVGAVDGMCRRRSPPPGMPPMDGDLAASWPITRTNDWCGEYEKKEQ